MGLLKWTLAVNGEAPSLMRGLNAHRSTIGNASLAPCPWSTGTTYTQLRGKLGRIKAFNLLNFDYRASAICKNSETVPSNLCLR